MTRHNLLLRDKYTCQYCGDIYPSRELTLDHVTPRSAGGVSSWENLVAACYPCNIKKGNKIPGKDHPHPRHLPHVPTARELQKNSRIVAEYNIHESWMDYLV
jgi:5-methylcytosine-specific restriction endonuclease McrA